MSEGVSLIIWPTTAKHSLISLWFYVLCQKLRKHCNGISTLKRAYLHNHWFTLYELKFIRKPRWSTLLSLCNAKWDFHTIKHHTANNPKLPNIAMLSKPTIYVKPDVFSLIASDAEFPTFKDKWEKLKQVYSGTTGSTTIFNLWIQLIQAHLDNSQPMTS